MNAPAYLSTQFAYDVRLGLGRTEQKQLPPSYLYDELGSALFEAITLDTGIRTDAGRCAPAETPRNRNHG